MFAIFAASLILLGVSGVLIDAHRRSWRAARGDETLSKQERRFARAQYFRRMQASGIIGVVGLAIGVKPLVPPEPLWMAVYLASLIGACVCIMLLAMLDLWASRQHQRRLCDDRLAEELQRVRQLRRGAESSSEPDSPGA